MRRRTNSSASCPTASHVPGPDRSATRIRTRSSDGRRPGLAGRKRLPHQNAGPCQDGTHDRLPAWIHAEALVGLVRPDEHAGDQRIPASRIISPTAWIRVATTAPRSPRRRRRPPIARCSPPSEGSRAARVSSRSAEAQAAASSSARQAWAQCGVGRQRADGHHSSRSGTATTRRAPSALTVADPGVPSAQEPRRGSTAAQVGHDDLHARLRAGHGQ